VEVENRRSEVESTYSKCRRGGHHALAWSRSPPPEGEHVGGLNQDLEVKTPVL